VAPLRDTEQQTSAQAVNATSHRAQKAIQKRSIRNVCKDSWLVRSYNLAQKVLSFSRKVNISSFSQLNRDFTGSYAYIVEDLIEGTS
jgi:hypothetical protein